MKKFIFLILLSSLVIGGDSRFKRINGVVKDNYTKLMWQTSDDGIKKNWYEAKKYCEELKLKGYNDWRLPTIDELMSIIDKNKYAPAINTKVFKCRNAYYWSSTETNNKKEKRVDARGISFKNGFNITYFKDYKDYVRCVRNFDKKN